MLKIRKEEKEKKERRKERRGKKKERKKEEQKRKKERERSLRRFSLKRRERTIINQTTLVLSQSQNRKTFLRDGLERILAFPSR